MTDPEFATRNYVEPITSYILSKIIEKERPDVLLPTLGGQMALNTAIEVAEKGIFEKYKVELIGANLNAIKMAEDRLLFKNAMKEIGLNVPVSGFAHTSQEANEVAREIGFPVIIRPSFTLGGTGGSVAYNIDEFQECIRWGLEESPVGEVLIEASVLGWKEYELEVMRDKKDNVVIVCSIENFDPMGVHTGDSVTIAPAQTLTDKEYQILRDASIAIIRKIGVETGGSNIQFAVNPENGEFVVIEMNPRVSRSSALASKATGFPIAKIAALLSVGYTLDEIPNDITKKTPACFEPTLDYVVTKIPRFTFEKFNTKDELTTQMRSVGEVMAIGRTFKESLQKAMRSLEIDSFGFEEIQEDDEQIRRKLTVPNSKMMWYIAEAIRRDFSIEEIYNHTKVDSWFLWNIKQIIEEEKKIKKEKLNEELLKEAKQYGFSDKRIGEVLGLDEEKIRKRRKKWNIHPAYKMVDTCAAEFEAYTPYFYSTYEQENESLSSRNKKIMILGGGPNRIGQGIEFDYCCVHAAFSLKEEGYETIMVNCNPETVSTDYDISDRLYFEPLTFEDVMNIVDNEKPDGVIVQFGGQTPLKLALSLKKAKVPIIGTDPENINIAEDRKLFRELIEKLHLSQPESGTATNREGAQEICKEIGYPVLVRPSYVLGGRAMEIIYSEEELNRYIKEAVHVSGDHPVLIDKFLEDAIEIDVDAVSDGRDTRIASIMQHIEPAGIHSGDSACSIPTLTLPPEIIDELKRQTYIFSQALNVIGLMNIQYAIRDGKVYVLEVNPRASRTVPFVSKSTGIPWAKVATKLMVGKTLKELNIKKVIPKYVSVKESVFPFTKFSEVDVILGPEMRSTGEVMGVSEDFASAFYKAQLAAGMRLPKKGNVFLTVRDKDKEKVAQIACQLIKQGFIVFSTKGTFEKLKEENINVEYIKKLSEGRPNIMDMIKNRQISLAINTPSGEKARTDAYAIRRATIMYNIPYCTTIEGAWACVQAIERLNTGKTMGVKSLQEYYEEQENG
jgi:carbamoyl-phosphate synthase large subunit